MFRTLIVEDDQPTVNVISRLINLWFAPAEPEEDAPQIDSAPTVDRAKELINEAKKHYHVVILDFKLPKHLPGDNPEVDESLCLLVRQKMPGALVGHITSHPGDQMVLDHIRVCHTERLNTNAFALSKNETDWPDKLLANLKAYLHGKPIEEALDRLYGKEDEDGLSSRPRRETRGRGTTSATHELAALCRKIVAHWDDLDQALQARIGRTFKLDTESRPIKINFF